MNQQRTMTEAERANYLHGKLQASLNISLLHQALSGEHLSRMVAHGDRATAVECCDGNEALASARIELAGELVQLVREGATLNAALDTLRKAGWIMRLDELEQGE
jgi:hypothetical protein